MSLTNYESQQISEIKKWKLDEPSVVSLVVGTILSPLVWLVNAVIPDAVIRGVLDFSSSAAEWLTDTDDLVRDSGVESVLELQTHNLEISDKLANEVHNWAIGVAIAEGGSTGAGGIFGMAIDIPAIIVLALRTVHKIGVCYGFEVRTKSDRDFVLAIMAASGANSMSEKVAALATLRAIEVAIIKETWKQLAKKAATEQIGKEAGIIAVKSLAKQLGVNLTKRKALQAIPIVGAAVGASVNGWYIKEVGWAARRAFQERWLISNQKTLEI